MSTSISHTPILIEPPIVPAVEPREQEYDDRATLALAGALLLIQAGLGFTWLALTTPDDGAGTFLSIVIDVLIATALLKGNGKYRIWAIGRIIMGLAIFSVRSLSQGDHLTAAVLALGYGGFLLVLIGQPSLGRKIAGTALYGLTALASFAGMVL